MTNLLGWFESRLGLRPLIRFLEGKTIPRHRHSVWYLFGGLSLLFFLIQLVTGMLLLLYYSPTPNTANESVRFIITQVPFGWLIRSLHSWSANLMIGALLVHLFSTYFMKGYRKPREMMWFSGAILMILIMGFGFTGYLLPWDTTSYFATQIGTEIPRSMPIVGEMTARILRGGEFIADESLKRLFALHVVILPVISILLILFHLVLNQVHGTSIPIGVQPVKPGIAFFPNYLYRDSIAWVCGILLLFWLALIFPMQLGTKADPLTSAPLGIRPEWYFLTLYETLRLVPGSLMGVSGETIVNLGVTLVGLLFFLVPFMDRRAAREEQSSVFTIVGIVFVLYVALAISLAYLT